MFEITQKLQNCEKYFGDKDTIVRRKNTSVGRGHAKKHYQHPTYIIKRVAEKDYRVLGAGLPEKGWITNASLTKIRKVVDLLGYEHMTAQTEEYKEWLNG